MLCMDLELDVSRRPPTEANQQDPQAAQDSSSRVSKNSSYSVPLELAKIKQKPGEQDEPEGQEVEFRLRGPEGSGSQELQRQQDGLETASTTSAPRQRSSLGADLVNATISATQFVRLSPDATHEATTGTSSTSPNDEPQAAKDNPTESGKNTPPTSSTGKPSEWIVSANLGEATSTTIASGRRPEKGTTTTTTTETPNTIHVNSSLPETSVTGRSGGAAHAQQQEATPTSGGPAAAIGQLPAGGKWNESNSAGLQVAKVGQLAGRRKFRCGNEGDCVHGICHRGDCYCAAGFTGDSCNLQIDECRQFRSENGNDEPPCLNGGTCIDQLNSFRCQCAPGFQGDRCQEEVDLCSVDPAPCLNGATCSNYRTFFQCNCAPGFRGKHCEINIDDCLNEPCTNGGQCFDLVNDFRCNCLAGFEGKQCQINIDDCATSGCFKNTTEYCIDLVNDFQCKCKPGFEGKRCQFDRDDCLEQPCQNNARCLDLVDGYKCSCQEGWTGKQCELDINECAIGGDALESSSQVESLSQSHRLNPICQNGGICQNLEPSYKCHCAEGWAGKSRFFFDLHIATCAPQSISKLPQVVRIGRQQSPKPRVWPTNEPPRI